MSPRPDEPQNVQHGQSRPHRMPTWLLILLGVIAGALALALLLWVFSIKDADGARLIDAPAASILVAFGIPGIAVLGRWMRDIRHQVQNSHAENLRDDLDGKHDVLVEKLDDLAERVDGRFDRLERRVDRNEADIDAIRNPKEKS